MFSVAAHAPVTSRPRLRRLLGSVGWHAVLPLLRAAARRRTEAHRPRAVTVLTVNWNSWDHLQVLIDVVRQRSPADTQILVIDNGSRDGSRDRLAARADISALLLPANLGHELALDLGVMLCDTEFVVALDVDAFPLHERWLAELLRPLDAGAHISGARLNREYVHPCCWAMRTARFVAAGHSFRSRYQLRAPGRDASGDVGEETSAREHPNLHFFEVATQRGPKDVGTVFGDLVYHNFYATRFRGIPDQRLDGAVSLDDAQRAWDEALRRYVL